MTAKRAIANERKWPRAGCGAGGARKREAALGACRGGAPALGAPGSVGAAPALGAGASGLIFHDFPWKFRGVEF